MTERQLQSRPSLRTGGPPLTFGSTRRTRGRRLAVLGALAASAALAVSGLGGTDGSDGASDGRTALAAPDPDGPAAAGLVGSTRGAAVAPGGSQAEAAADSSSDLTPGTPPLATVDGVELYVPTAHPLVIGYHEASLRGVLGMVPRGELVDNANTTKFVAPDDDPDGLPYVVMSSRGRVFPATSAVDVVMEDDEPVLSPVSGRVVQVRDYALYGQYADTRIELEPEGVPDRHVVLIHVTGVQVRAGDEVIAGRTVLASSANRFPFSSHVDRYLDPNRWPHVHMEVKDPSATLDQR